jgi:hypothetical protein
MITDDTRHLNIPNYNLTSIYTRQNRYGGCCILVRNNLKCKLLPAVNKVSVAKIIECCGIELVEHKIILICIYRPPRYSKEDIYMFFSKFEQILKNHCFTKHKVVICGDFNIDLLKKNNLSDEFEQVILTYNMKISLKEITRSKSGSCLDNFVHNVKNSKCKVSELALSDHSAQLFTCPVDLVHSTKHWYVERRDYCKDNVTKFQQHVASLSFNDVYEANDPNVAFEKFYDMFMLLYNLCFPTVNIKVSNYKRPKWISRGIVICSKRKRSLLWNYRKNRNEVHKNIFKNYSKRFSRIVKLTQKAQNNHLIKKSDNKSKATWSIINKNKCSVSKDIDQLNVNGKIIDKPLDISQAFNNFFIDQIEARKSDKVSNTLTFNNPNSVFMTPTTEHDINKIIMSLRNTHSTGYDGVSTYILKKVSVIISVVLSHIINLCIANGVYPEKLKLTIVKPLFKKGDRDNINCYRPIALIPIIAKIFEKVIYHIIYSYFEKFNLFSTEQIGFRKNKNINMAMHNLLETVITAMDKRIPVAALYMDLTKAFDFVDHGILLKKMEAYGVRGVALTLLKSYLSNRKQATAITKICLKSCKEIKYLSDYRDVKYGVPQGSILGPLMFIIYINDLPNIVKQQIILFADDSTVIFTGPDALTLSLEIRQTLQNIINWLNSNNLLINLDKTNIMTFKNRGEPITLDVSYLNKKIETTNQTKFLGINIDNNLNWKTHAEYVRGKLSQFSYALYMLAKVADIGTVVTAYHAFAGSILRYGIIFWGNSCLKEYIFKAQKKCIRAMWKLQQTDSCKPYFIKFNILTLPCIFILEVAIYVKSNLHMFKTFKSTRRNKNLVQIMSNSELYKKSVFCLAPAIYNHLPKALKDIGCLAVFKVHLKKFLQKKGYYTINEYLTDKSL